MSEESEKKLEKLLKPMNLPWNRKKEFTPAKLRWLMKNIDKFNKTHKNRDSAIELITLLIKNG